MIQLQGFLAFDRASGELGGLTLIHDLSYMNHYSIQEIMNKNTNYRIQTLKFLKNQWKMMEINENTLTSVEGSCKIAELSYLTAFAIQQIIYNRISRRAEGLRRSKRTDDCQ